MKKYFFILFLFCHNSFASDFVNQGIMLDLTKNGFVYSEDKAFTSKSRLAVELPFDHNYQSNLQRNEFEDIGFRARFNNNFSLSRGFSLNSNLLLTRFDTSAETARRNSLNKGDNRYFENIGIALREFNISKSGEKYSLIAGKFNLNFGNAWRWNRGIWIHEIADVNYRQVEKLGLAAIYRLGDLKKTGQYNFSFASFTNDRKNFDNALFLHRNSDAKSDAIAGDTRSLKSYMAALDVNFDFGEKEKLSYHFSYLKSAINKRAAQLLYNNFDDQKSFALNVDYHYPISENITINPFLEYVKLRNLNGNRDIDEKYFTANFIAKFGNHWSFLFGKSKRQNKNIAAADFQQSLREISLGYEFDKNTFFDGLTIQTGFKDFKNNQNGNEDTKSFGVLLRYYKNF